MKHLQPPAGYETIMKTNLILEDFTAELPYLIDKERFDVIKTSEEGTWIVRKKEVVLGTGDIKVDSFKDWNNGMPSTLASMSNKQFEEGVV